MNQKNFLHPENIYRIYKLSHDVPHDMASHIDSLAKDGFGGVVINADWHTEEGDLKTYLCEKEDFEILDRNINTVTEKGFGLWLYDEKGYPSGSADGLTLENHPEYEARGLAELQTDGNAFECGTEFEKILYATDVNGTPVPFEDKSVMGADYVYAIRPVFQGSHAEKCGWGPRRYPNLMNKDAVRSFIRCTYDKYYTELSGFDKFEAVFTDEPSLMACYVNCAEHMPYAFIPWEETLPEIFEKMHGKALLPLLHEIFSESGDYSDAKRMFWETVGEMTKRAYFDQIAAWCGDHDIKFSGHCLLEESLAMHVELYGDIMKCLKSFDYPGVDMLTGNPDHFRHGRGVADSKYAMAAKYVGSAARMTGKTEKVMVEICPLPDHNGGVEFTPEQEIGTMDLLFMCGINHINSYLVPERLNGRFKEYADYFARAAYMLRGATWCGQIGMYYPIETAAGCTVPSHTGINVSLPVSETLRKTEETMFASYSDILENGMDFTIVDGEWLLSATLENGIFKANGLEISALVMPGTVYVSDEVLARLDTFTSQDGNVIWLASKPEKVRAEVLENAAPALKETVSYGIHVTAENSKDLLVSPYIKNGKKLFYLINSSPEANTVTISLDGDTPFTVWQNLTGEVSTPATAITHTFAPYTSVFVCEEP